MSVRILIVEDELRMARLVELELEREGFDAVIAGDGDEGLRQAMSGDFDLIILDLMLPGLNGMEICRRVRKHFDTPIIMLTARDDIMDKVMGLDIGADDYITKPFAMEELLARVRASLRRKENKNTQKDVLSVDSLIVDKRSREVSFDGNHVELTKREFDLLSYMAANLDTVLTREMLLEKVWGFDYYGDTNVVDVYIRYLRSKIDDVFGVRFIHTIRGMGYMMKRPAKEKL